MKKIFFLIALFFIFVCLPCFASEDDNVLNLHAGNSYILFLDERPLNLQNSNTRILKVDLVTNVLDNNSSLLITAVEEGISYITYKINEETKTLKILIDNNSQDDKNLIKLDKVNGFNTK
jgi:hypothetical protein